MSAGIELLRGLAALMVVLAHYRGFAGFDGGLAAFAFTGVDLFFVISGFVFAPYLAGKALSWDAFLIRRFFRIYPLYVVALVLYALLRVRDGASLDYVLPHLLFLHTTQSREIAFHFNPAFWSLPVEVEFYLALPLLALVVRGWRAFAGLLLLSLLVHIVVARLLPLDPAAETLAVVLAFHLPSLLVEFLLGTAGWFVWRQRLGAGLQILLFALGLILCITLALTFSSLGDAGVHANGWLRGNLSLLAALSYALMLCAVLSWVERASPSAQRMCLSVGNLSFGIYLLHNAMPPLLAPWQSQLAPQVFAALCLLTTLLAAWGLHHWVEAPMRSLGRALADRRERQAALGKI